MSFIEALRDPLSPTVHGVRECVVPANLARYAVQESELVVLSLQRMSVLGTLDKLYANIVALPNFTALICAESDMNAYNLELAHTLNISTSYADHLYVHCRRQCDDMPPPQLRLPVTNNWGVGRW